MGSARAFVKTIAGSVIELVRPDLGRAIDTATGSGPQARGSVRARQWILHARLERARWRGDHMGVRRALAGFWRGDTADFFYARFRDRFQTSFLGAHQIIVDQLVALDQMRPFASLVEVGCGDGQVLAHCAKRLPGLAKLTGIDINPRIIAANRETWAASPRLSFVCDDAVDWLSRNATDDMVLFSYGGVMEYLDETDLTATFAALGRRHHVAVALVEPLSPAHDLDADLASFVFGQENSFSHNYPHLLRKAGFTLHFEQQMELDGVRWIMVLASVEENS
jgi:SAM-dependent methyltransferase